MTDSTKKVAVTRGNRIYQYTDQDGRVFWSFEKFPSIITHSRTMTLGDRVGTHFDSYLAELRATRRFLLDEEKDKGLGRG